MVKTNPIKANFRRTDGFCCVRIEIAAVAALLRNDISGQFKKTNPIQSQTKPIALSTFEDGQGDHASDDFYPAAFDDDSDDLIDVFVGARCFFFYFAPVAGDEFDTFHAAFELLIAN